MQPCCQFFVVKRADILAAAAEVAAYKIGNLFELGGSVLAAVKQTQIVKYLVLCAYQNSGQQFLICNGIGLEMVRYNIVYVLDEYYIGIQVIQVLNECAVTARTEQYGSVIIAERTAVGIGRNGIGAGLLL